MTDIYEDFAIMVREMLQPANTGALGQGSVVLRRSTSGAPPANEWDPPSDPVIVDETLFAAAEGVDSKFVDGETIKVTDLQVITAPPVMGYEPGDLLIMDEKGVMILRVDKIPAVGPVSAVMFFVRR